MEAFYSSPFGINIKIIAIFCRLRPMEKPTSASLALVQIGFGVEVDRLIQQGVAVATPLHGSKLRHPHHNNSKMSVQWSRMPHFRVDCLRN